LPSGKTVGVYLKEYLDHHVESLDRLNVKLNRTLWKKSFGHLNRKRIILDYDSTTMTVYGKQEGADRGHSFRKKDHPGFQPKFAFIGGLGLMVNQELLPQSHNLSKNFLEFHHETLSKLPRKVDVWAVRGDAALYCLGNIRAFEKNNLTYAVSAACPAALRDEILAIPESAWVEGQDEYGHPISAARIRYCPPTWKKEGEAERTYIVSRRLKEDPGQGVRPLRRWRTGLCQQPIDGDAEWKKQPQVDRLGGCGSLKRGPFDLHPVGVEENNGTVFFPVRIQAPFF
jgi:hypothetical protein